MQNANEEAFLKVAFQEYYALLAPAYPGAEELAEVCISEKTEKKMARLFRRQKRFYYKLFNDTAKRAACIAAALLLVVAGVGSYFRYTDAPEQTAEVENVQRPTGLEDEVNSNGIGEGSLSSEEILYPSYIVEGFEQEEYSKGTYRLDTENYYRFQQTLLTERDIEHFETVEAEWITVADRYPGYYEVSAGLNHLWYYTEDYCFVIWGTISNEELLKVAESVDYGPENKILKFFKKIFK